MSRSNRNSRFFKFAGILSGLLGVQLSLPAQTSATISGTVKDTSGKPVKGASLRLAGRVKGGKGRTVAGDDGAFVFPQLQPDSYEITASGPEYSDYMAQVQVGVGQTRMVNIVLNSASESTVVAIENKGTTMDRSSARTGINVTGRELSAVPLNGRSYSQLALTAPGSSNAGDGATDKLRFNGKSAQQNRFTYDGIDTSSVINAVPGSLTVSGSQFRLQNSVENLQEFRVDSALYPAEYGASTGGQIITVSKSGASEWHGSLFEYFRNDKLQAPNYFDEDNDNPLRMNQFGANAGGSVVKDKLFVFGAFEGLRQRVGMDIDETVPSAAARSKAAPAIRPLLAAFPAGNAKTGNPDVDLACRRGLARMNETTFNARIDYTASPSERFYVRYFKETGILNTPDLTVSDRIVEASTKPDNLVASWSGVSHGIINDLKFGVNRSPLVLTSTTGAAGLGAVRISMNGSVAADAISTGAFAEIGGMSRQITPGRGLDYRGKSYTISDNALWLLGAHTVKGGFEFRAIRVPMNEMGGTYYGFSNMTAFLANKVSRITYTGDLGFHVGQQEHYLGYLQDEWRPRPDVTLNAGLRYEYFSPTRERDNRARVFDIGTFRYLDAGKDFYRAEDRAFSPRLGLTWAPNRMHGNTVIRVGGGMYYGPGQYGDTFQPIQNDTTQLTWFGRVRTYPADVPALISQGAGLPVPYGYDVAGYNPVERSIQYGLSVQQQLPFRLIGQAGYSGALGRNLFQRSYANAPVGVDPVTAAMIRPNPLFDDVDYRTSGGRDSYNALQLGLTRRFVEELTLGMAYSWSHAIGTSQGSNEAVIPQNSGCWSCERADDPTDIRQTLSFTALYDLPVGTGKRHLNTGAMARVFGNWSLGTAFNARTGLPVNVTISRPASVAVETRTGRIVAGVGAPPAGAVAVLNSPKGSRRPNLVPGVDPYLRNGASDWLNPAAFSTPKPGEYGNLGRNALRGPGFAQLDLMLSRRFSLGEKHGIEARVEAFNLLNATNYANPVATLPDASVVIQPGEAFSATTAPSFGQMLSTVGRTVGLGTSRQVQVGLRYSF